MKNSHALLSCLASLSTVAFALLSGCAAAIDDDFPSDEETGGVSQSEQQVVQPLFSNQTCVAVGTNRAVIRSSNGGVSWQLVPTPEVPGATNYSLRTVVALSSRMFYAAGDAGRVFWSYNGGASWVLKSVVPDGATKTLYDIAWDGGTRLVAAGRPHVIYTSSDMGVTWTQSDWNEGTDTEAMNRVVHAGGNRFIAVGDYGRIAESNDGGQSWTLALQTDTWPSWCNLTGLANLGGGKMLTVGGGGWRCVQGWNNLRSGDNGASWAPFATPSAGASLGLAHDDNGNLIAVGGTIGHAIISTDEGDTWTGKDLSTLTNRRFLNSVAWNRASDSWIAVGGPNVLRSVDVGQTWVANPQIPKKDGQPVILVDVSCVQ